MYTYTLTAEIRTPWWKKLLRWMSLWPPMNCFKIDMHLDIFNKGDLVKLTTDVDLLFLVLDKQRVDG